MKVLHVGCGGGKVTSHFDGWEEVRLDINPEAKPDIVASMVDLGDIGTFDAVYCSHSLEHLYPHEVKKALAEFKRVTPNGFVFLVVPDLEGVTLSDEVLYQSGAGPVTAIDMFYGYTNWLEGTPAMAHHTGFTKAILERALAEAGFAVISVVRDDIYNLVAIAFTSKPSFDVRTMLNLKETEVAV